MYKAELLMKKKLRQSIKMLYVKLEKYTLFHALLVLFFL